MLFIRTTASYWLRRNQVGTSERPGPGTGDSELEPHARPAKSDSDHRHGRGPVGPELRRGRQEVTGRCPAAPGHTLNLCQAQPSHCQASTGLSLAKV